MKNIFVLYVFDIVRFYIFNNMFGQTLSSLIFTKPRMQSKNRQREYYLNLVWSYDNQWKLIRKRENTNPSDWRRVSNDLVVQLSPKCILSCNTFFRSKGVVVISIFNFRGDLTSLSSYARNSDNTIMQSLNSGHPKLLHLSKNPAPGRGTCQVLPSQD
jgi:hypothetical protein